MSAPTMRDIAKVHAEKARLSLDEMRGPIRERRVSWPRQNAMVEMRGTGRYTLGQIGRFFYRDHTTVIHAMRAVASRQARGAGH